jgi:hypothetical protein
MDFLLDRPSPDAGDSVDLSLSVVLPVHNAESTLARNVSELLDVLPEIAARFEILIVDDGSTDHTEELAYELAREYPQVRVVRHSQRRGGTAALQTGMIHTLGDVVFVHDEASPIRATELRALWNMRFDEELIAARAEPPHRAVSSPARGLPPRWGEAAQTSLAAPGLRGTQMIRRRGLDELAVLEARAQASRHLRRHTCPQRPEPVAAR